MLTSTWASASDQYMQPAVFIPFNPHSEIYHLMYFGLIPFLTVLMSHQIYLSVPAEVMQIETLSTHLTSGLYHLISLGSAKRWTLCFGIYKINPINGKFAQDSVEFLVYEGVSNPIKSGFAFLYEAQHCAGSYGLTSCQTGTNYK